MDKPHVLDSINEEKEHLLCRIVGVTDDILREQLQQDYTDLATREAKEVSIAECMFWDSLSRKNTEFLRKGKTKCGFVEAFDKANATETLESLCNKHRVRMPVNPDRRTLINLVKAFGFKLTICELNGDVADTIGDECSKKQITMYREGGSYWCD